ncbi:MAG: SDR family oxidoreductase [Candidatus Sumerlaeia bacterium]|nr:SDR family oxidoreductase [Candidatus Sumerlaeia bacterium]
MNIDGATALVTGSGRRVGRAIALALAERGANIIVHCYQSYGEAEETAAQVNRLGRRATVFSADQRDWNAVERLCRQAWDVFGGIDVLVNNAAVYRRTPLGDLGESDWDEMLDVDLKGPFAFARFLGLRMKERGRGKIISISDAGARVVWPGYIPYCVAKAGVEAMTRGLARALAPEVQVNAIAAGTVLWPEGFDAQRQEAALRGVPMRRTGSPADVARAVCYLVEYGDYITGVVLPVDGGRHLGG